MKSLTKTSLNSKQIQTIITHAFSEDVVKTEEVHNGFYNAIYRIFLKNSTVYLKIAPSDDIDILTYEKDIIKREVKVYQLFEELGIPSPVILFQDFTKSIIRSNYYIMSEVPGKTLHELQLEFHEKYDHYKQVVEYMAKIHSVEMDTFGYDNQEKHFESYGDTILYMYDNAIHDGERKNVEILPIITEFRELIIYYKYLLDKTTKPILLHFDAWDGNVMAVGPTVTGLIDTERSFNGSPIADLVCVADPRQPMFKDVYEHYNKHAKVPIPLNDETNILYTLHRGYLFTLMYVECNYRDIEGSFDWQRNWAVEEITGLLNYLKEQQK